MRHTHLSFVAAVFLISIYAARAQNAVAIGTNSPNPKAVLTLVGSNQGLIIPKVSNVTDIGTVTLAETGMIVFNTTDSKVYAFNGTTWSTVGASGSGSTYTLSYDPTTKTISLISGSSGTPSISISATALTGDLGGTLGAPTVTGIQGKNITLPSNTGYLAYDVSQAKWVFQNPSGALPTAGANQILTSNNSSVPTWSTTISGNAITSGTIGGSTAINSTGAITTTSAATVAGLTVSGPTTSLNNKTYTWPNNPTLTAGTVLQTDASGNLSWVTPSGGLPAAGANQILTSNASSVPTWSSTISGNAITSGTIGGTTAINSTGAATVAGLTVSGATTSLNSKTYTWPNNPTLTAGTFLQTDASGNLSWGTPSGALPAPGPNQILTSNSLSAPSWANAINGSQVIPTFVSQPISTSGSLTTGVTTKFGTITYNWPNAALVAGTFLKTDASGNLSWAVPSPSGTAGGDLGGTYPNPTVAKLGGQAYTFPASNTTVGVLTNATGNGTLTWAPVSGFLTTGLPSGNIIVGNSAGIATNTAMSGDATMSSTGALTIATTSGNNIVNAINSAATTASITDSKLATISTLGKVSGTAIQTGQIGGNTIINTSGDIMTTGGSLAVFGTTTFGGIKYSWPTTPLAAPTKYLSTDAAGNLNWATVPSPFSTLNTIPKGDGTTLIASQILDDGTNVGIGVTNPNNKLESNGNIVNSNPTQGTLGLTGDLPGYSTGVYPTLKTSGNDIFFSVAGKYSGYLGGTDAGLALNSSAGGTNVYLNTNGDSYFSGGNVGIGTNTPGSILDVNGNALFRGEVNAPATSSANLIPIAYGNITASGGTNSGTGNFTVVWNVTSSWYEITITGQSYSFANYVTSVTPWGSNATCSTNSVSGKLLVIFQNLSGANIQVGFQFVVYKP